MPKYKCTNEECDYFNREIEVHGTRLKIVNNEVVDESGKCFNCGSDRVVVREPGITTNIAGTNDQRNRMAKQF